MCGYCPGATVGEARAFYQAVRDGSVTEQMAQKMSDHATRASLPERQRAELSEDPTLFLGQPEFKAEVAALLSWWDDQEHPKGTDNYWNALNEFEARLVCLREQYDEVHVDEDFDRLVATAPTRSQQVLAGMAALAHG
ncbi:MAG: hypothetical protein INF43_00955 [Alphaproteobacteria bacterium]|nr:hypothetical protein [Alphaproteobacteria bacterium]